MQSGCDQLNPWWLPWLSGNNSDEEPSQSVEVSYDRLPSFKRGEMKAPIPVLKYSDITYPES